MPEPTDSFVEVTSDGGVVTVRIVASSVEENAAQAMLMRAKEAMDQVGGGLTDVVLDFGGVEFINSSGLGSLVSIMKETRLRKGRLTLSDLASYVQEIFDITQLTNIFEIFPTEKEALGSYQSVATS